MSLAALSCEGRLLRPNLRAIPSTDSAPSQEDEDQLKVNAWPDLAPSKYLLHLASVLLGHQRTISCKHVPSYFHTPMHGMSDRVMRVHKAL